MALLRPDLDLRGQVMKGHVREHGKGNWYVVLSVRDPATRKRKVQWRRLNVRA